MKEQRGRSEFHGSGEAAVESVYQEIARQVSATTFLGYDNTTASSRVTALTAAELEVIVRKDPFGAVADNPSRLLVFVLSNPADRAKLRPLARQDWAPEALAIGARVAYVWCPDSIVQSRAVEAVGRLLGDATTSRNWATMTKLLSLALHDT